MTYIFVGEQRIDKLVNSAKKLNKYSMSPHISSASVSPYINPAPPLSLGRLSRDDIVAVPADLRTTGTQTHPAASASTSSASTQTDTLPPPPPSPQASHFHETNNFYPPDAPKPVSNHIPVVNHLPVSSSPLPSRLSEAVNFFSTDYMRLSPSQVDILPHSKPLFFSLIFFSFWNNHFQFTPFHIY